MTVRDNTNPTGPTGALDLRPIARPSLDLTRVGDRFPYHVKRIAQTTLVTVRDPPIALLCGALSHLSSVCVVTAG
jgi:hypothetical protein